MPVIPVFEKKEKLEFQVILGSIANLRLVWCYGKSKEAPFPEWLQWAADPETTAAYEGTRSQTGSRAASERQRPMRHTMQRKWVFI